MKVSNSLQIIRVFIFAAIALLGSSTLAAQEVRVAAASDLSYALKELAPSFEKATGKRVQVTLGSSGNLSAQIANGAPFDVFLSADSAYPRQLADSGVADATTFFVYGRGTLVLWVPRQSPLDPDRDHEQILRSPQLHRLAIANPKHAPYGRAAQAAIRSWGLEQELAPKLVIGENISQTAQFVESGNAQAGLLALSLVVQGPLAGKGKYWQVPDTAYPQISQAAVAMKKAQDAAAARAFIDYLKSPSAQSILRHYGFRQ